MKQFLYYNDGNDWLTQMTRKINVILKLNLFYDDQKFFGLEYMKMFLWIKGQQKI